LDGKEPPVVAEFLDLDAPSPSILSREAVQEPLFTGNKIVDTLIPIGKGQRQLLIGDNGLGKSSLAVDIVVNQKDHGRPVRLRPGGQRRSGVMSVLETLRSSGALAHTLVVVAESTALPGPPIPGAVRGMRGGRVLDATGTGHPGRV
jgi:F-type H+-transporting ATPase subunit alpha